MKTIQLFQLLGNMRRKQLEGLEFSSKDEVVKNVPTILNRTKDGRRYKVVSIDILHNKVELEEIIKK